jgi:SAM-dependent methyltransferase
VDSDRTIADVPQGGISPQGAWAEITGLAPQRELDWLALGELHMRASERLLVVQCGDGWAVEEAWRRVTRSYVRGVDTSPTLVGLATGLRGVPGKVEFDTWNGRQLPLSDGSFDRVVSRFAIAPSPEPVLMLREMHRVLCAGGELYVLEARRDPGARGAEPTAGVPELRGLLESAGFVRVEERAPRREGGRGGLILHAQRSPESPRVPASCE